ncbi:MAG: PIN domain-containing protein [Gammaproteobacteria bacterium]|nr:PIN domain-containing protein [Gammaproteobacteria bacterium]
MYLVDTSVWIDYINGTETKHVQFLDQLLSNPLAVGLSELIYMEILQGAKNQKAFDKFMLYFSGQKFYQLLHQENSYQDAAQIFFNCRRQGITIRSTVDCLIAQCTIENELILLHNDRDFLQMANVVPLRQKCFIE